MPRPPRMLLLTLVAVLAALPVIVTAFSPWAGATSVLVLSLLPVLGVARGGIRSMVLVSAAAAVTVLVSLLLVQTGPLLPWLGTALVVGLAVLASPLVKIGRESTGALAIVLAVYLMAVPDSASAPFASMGPLGVAVALGALVAFTTAWASAVIWLALRRVRIPASEVPPPTLPYTLLLAFLAGLFTFVTLMWFRETNAWWSVLTVAVVLQPTGAKLASRVLARVAGTVLGGGDRVCRGGVGSGGGCHAGGRCGRACHSRIEAHGSAVLGVCGGVDGDDRADVVRAARGARR